MIDTVLVVTSSWPRTRDEIAGTFVRSDALSRAAGGARVVVAAPRGPGAARSGPGLEIVDVPHLGAFGSPGAVRRISRRPHRVLGLFPFARAIAELVDRVEPTLIVAHWLLPCGAIVRSFANGRRAIEVVAHGGDVRLLEALPRAIASSVLEAIVAPGVVVRAVSTNIETRLRRMSPRVDPVVAPMPLAEGDLGAARAHGQSLRARFGPLQVVVSRLAPEKGIERAIDRVARSGGRLVLVGDGPARQALVRRARARGVDLVATGAVRHRDALAWIAAADAVLAPLAPGEGAPTVVREAKALGVPVVTFGA